MKSFWTFLQRNKLYGAINLAGLAISMTFVILLAVYVQQQLSTDNFQKNADRIYVIANDENVTMAYWLDKYLSAQLPEIEKGAFVQNIGKFEFQVEGHVVYPEAMLADSTFFDIFSYEVAEGSKADWAVSKDYCMVSQAFARTHFGDQSPVGRTIGIGIGNRDERYSSLTVCGVYKDFGNSILRTPEVLIRGDLAPALNTNNDEYMSNAASGITFVMARPGADLPAKHDQMLQWMKENFWVYKGFYQDVRIIPLRDIYFLKQGSEDTSGTLQSGNRQFVNLLATMCIVLLLFAILNYVNMTMALAGFRAKEMATRRLVGAQRSGIFLKIIGESTVVCALATVLAVLLAESLAPLASRTLDYPVSVFGALTPANELLLLVFIGLLGLMAGIVPALVIQRAQPIEVVRGTLRFKTKTVYSRVIIVLQNVVTVTLLVIVLTMYLQIRHMQTADLGYNTVDLLLVQNSYGRPADFQVLTDRWESLPQVEAVGMGNSIPLTGTNNFTVQMADDSWVSFQQIEGDQTYFDLLGLRVKTDHHAPGARWWFNEYAFKEMGIDEDQKEVRSSNGTMEIGGIYYDFKIQPLEEAQSAALIRNYGTDYSSEYPWSFLIKTTGSHREAREQVEAVAREVFPDKLFHASYIDELIAEEFKYETLVLAILSVFTLLSVLVSALGLFAMSSYYMQQERRSVSVKKAFGASSRGVLRELVLSFMRMVAVAFLVSVPVSWLLMHHWLQGYTHRIGLHWWIFAAAGAVTAVISAASVLYQSARTARTNPATVLKKE